MLLVWMETETDAYSSPAFVKVAKNRHGRTGKAELCFIGECKRFMPKPAEAMDNYENGFDDWNNGR